MTHVHTDSCEWVRRNDGRRRCLTNYRAVRNPRDRELRAERKARYLITAPVDGLEEEFGSCPPPVLDRDWYDQVAVDRAVQGVPVGRILHHLEAREVERIRAARQAREEEE